jgi:hypothetical protein
LQSEARAAGEEAEQFLRDLLAGGPVPAKEGEKQARELGMAGRTLRRARKKVGAIAEKGGLKEGWTWRLPTEGGQHFRRGRRLLPGSSQRPREDMRVFVAAATGVVGSRLILLFVSAGHSVLDLTADGNFGNDKD